MELKNTIAINNAKPSDDVKAPIATEGPTELKTDTPKTDVEPTPKDTEPKASEATVKSGSNIVVEFIAGGAWVDQSGKTWCKQARDGMINSQTFTKDGLESREDIRFMIEYGSMRAITIE